MKLILPELSLVALVGPSGCGKSTFARRHFKPTEILASDFFRALVSDDENNQAASKDAFDLLYATAAKRLSRRLLTVIDATNVQTAARTQVLDLAKRYHYLSAAIVFNLPEEVCLAYDGRRVGRNVGPHVIRNHARMLRQSLRKLEKEGFRHVYVLSSPEEVASVAVERQRLWVDRRDQRGPFDLIGDVHGCREELVTLLCQLGYRIAPVGERGGVSAPSPGFIVTPPEGRKAVFVGDLVDRGPDVPGVLRLVMGMVESGAALCVLGNHDDKLLRKLNGHNVKINHGLAETLAQLEAESDGFRQRVRAFLDGLISHYVLDDGKLVVAHAGLKEHLQGRASGRVRAFALYGDTTGATDEAGLPVRLDWAADYRGQAMVVYGHTPVAQPEWLNRTINIDSGCVFGGRLTALRYPENELVSVPALRQYCEPGRAFLPPVGEELSAQQSADDMLDLADVTGTRRIATRLMGEVSIRAENSAAALEVMSRFAADPRWLIYLPPTMSPCETSRQPGLLEHPAEAFAYYRNSGVERVVCQQKHMGSRCVVLVCRDEAAARRTFDVEGESGIFLTRTGRRFFEDAALERDLLTRVRAALDASAAWERWQTNWVCLDCELMPWSAKAQELLRQQYAAVGAASKAALSEVVEALKQPRSPEVKALHERHRRRAEAAERFTDAYRRYCWPIRSADDYKLAPFHLLATEGVVHSDKNHLWHMEQLATMCPGGESLLLATTFEIVEVRDEASIARGVRWWQEMTERGGEGMVVKPLDFVVRGKRGLVQPAVKCRGPEYLRIIYGPEYAAPEHLERLRSRGLGFKRSLALREFALGVESLERFVRREPLRRVHECCFAVLALESEPVDPRL